MYTKEVVVGNIFEKYDNPIAEVVQKACGHESVIHVQSGSRRVNMKSIMGIMAVKWNEGATVEISAEGADAEAAVEEICSYLSCR